MDGVETRLAALEAKLDRMAELIQQDFVRTRAEISALRADMDERFSTLRVDIAERFQSVLDRLDLLEHRVEKNSAMLEEVRADIGKLRNQVYALDGRIDALQMSVNGLGDDMRQRFRVVNDRLAAVERRLAA